MGAPADCCCHLRLSSTGQTKGHMFAPCRPFLSRADPHSSLPAFGLCLLAFSMLSARSTMSWTRSPPWKQHGVALAGQSSLCPGVRWLPVHGKRSGTAAPAPVPCPLCSVPACHCCVSQVCAPQHWFSVWTAPVCGCPMCASVVSLPLAPPSICE